MKRSAMFVITTIFCVVLTSGTLQLHSQTKQQKPKEHSTSELTIAGVVRVAQSTQQQPRAGASVVVRNYPEKRILARTTTDNEGQYMVLLPPKSGSVEVVVEAQEYYTEIVLLRSSVTDTATFLRQDFALSWKNVLASGYVRAARTGKPVTNASVSVRREGTEPVIMQTTTNEHGRYFLTLPKETALFLTAQSGDYFFETKNVIVGRIDKGFIERNFLLPEELTLRINFPSMQFDNPLPNVLDSNGVATSIPWEEEVSNVAKNLVLYKSIISKLTIIGHTDGAGNDKANMALGLKRAEFLQKELIKRGVPANIIEVQSKGKSDPLPRRAEESDEIYDARCRRVELVKTKR